MIKVALIGQGNVSFHLARAFRTAEKVQVSVYDSREESSKIEKYSADICIVAVSDSAIKEVSEKLQRVDAIVAHTSGSVSINELPNDYRRGVFYPLQTFTKEKELDFTNIPICVETENKDDLDLLSELAKSISKNVNKVSSAQRKSLHMAAVFANNFTNHLYQVAYDICDENKLSFDLIKPLIIETADKIRTLSPFQAQTGPARRNDVTTISKHIELLENFDRKEIYSQLSKSIQKTHGKEL